MESESNPTLRVAFLSEEAFKKVKDEGLFFLEKKLSKARKKKRIIEAMNTLESLDFSQVKEKVYKYFTKHKRSSYCLLPIGLCAYTYRGKASSILEYCFIFYKDGKVVFRPCYTWNSYNLVEG